MVGGKQIYNHDDMHRLAYLLATIYMVLSCYDGATMVYIKQAESGGMVMISISIAYTIFLETMV